MTLALRALRVCALLWQGLCCGLVATQGFLLLSCGLEFFEEPGGDHCIVTCVTSSRVGIPGFEPGTSTM